MTSLRRRLFVLLLAATGAIWLSAVVWIFLVSRAELEGVLDTRVQEAAKMVHSLVASGNMATATNAAFVADIAYERQLSCQIWSLDGKLVARSSGAPGQSLADETEGFANRLVDDELWRVYTIVDEEKGVRVAVGDRIGLRNRLVRDLIAGLLGPAALVAPLLGVLIWFGLGRGLSPLRIVAGDIESRTGDDMRAIDAANAPVEVRPLLAALNGLFGKVEAAQRHEREITAFAAHELRTPLAGLKTQAQIALAAEDRDTRNGALRQILVSVDRAGRLVRQLLALSRLEASPGPDETTTVNAGAALREVIHQQPLLSSTQVSVDPMLDTLALTTDRDSLALVLRNLHENAVDHSGPHGKIQWLATAAGLAVEDNGPGIPESELALVTQRFYRGRYRSINGTGLGLTIADTAARRIGARLTFENLPQGGLRVGVEWETPGTRGLSLGAPDGCPQPLPL